MASMARRLLPVALSVCCTVAIAAKPVAPKPLADGDYTFAHRFAEQPSMPSVSMHVRIRKGHIVVTNESVSSAFEKGVVDEGLLLWHPATQQWIIGDTPADAKAPEVGGCSGGPEVIDLAKRIYWTC
ncbi:hypothetical protein LYSHEL_29670 [Lysobacter helvus]|uniref:Uncharacterized protein n=3 Tax=Lysobacterales TaxID=135614 RepID=A0ABN6FX64_9GAMM|nr:hypothetical protein LYSCAS_29640 [Lysobacter caseinilyticus]BCT97096.1 hypothetical protein LYSHEL_29670 [Lysobacter helvus]